MSTSLGCSVATALTGSWRATLTPLEVTPQQLADIAPLLVEGGAAALAWRRLGNGRLRNSAPGRSLRDAYFSQSIAVERAERILADAFQRLRDAGIEPILIKGWVASHLYTDLALRPYSDIDLCVDPRQFEAAKQVVESAKGKLIDVELHEGVPDLDERPWSEIVSRSRRVPLGASMVRALGAEDQLRQLCIHYLRHSALKPLWLCDIAAAIEQLPSHFDWPYFRGGDVCANQWTMCFLGLACHLLGATTTAPDILRATETLPVWLIDNVLWRWGNGLRRLPLTQLLKRLAHFPSVVRHHWLNRMTIAYRSNLAPDCSLTKVLAFATLQQPIKAGLRLRRIVTTRFHKWIAAPDVPCNLHRCDASRYL
jgi:hypothetical protein